ncbi:hypothetical protein [Burkholderia stabilis]|uniref:Uncharacterized protein n=1 Tax=Burkholderia stabilis TaxID=95485 RepID=A0A1Y1BBF6_9BURK|nr:hypothetical protein [Burkholderia stabilis]BAX57281.1 hypothetical protein BSFP_000670 [Burkholderia stabilis]
MMRFTRTLMAMTLILGVTDMASAKNERGYFEIRSGAGQTNPAPTMVITDEGKTLSYYSRGRDLDHSSQGRYLGIGRYTTESSDGHARQLAEIKHVLSRRDPAIRDAVNAGPVLSYSFDMDGQHYEGAFNYQAEKPVQDKIVVLYSLAKELLAQGKPDINLHPAFSIRTDTKRLLVELVFRNEGRQEVVIDGPDSWTDNLAIPSRQYVEIRGSNSEGADFKVRLDRKYLIDASRRYASEIAVKPGEVTRVEFAVPYVALSFGSDSSIQRMESGTYNFVGRMQGNFDKPDEMSGRFFTWMDPVPSIGLTRE